MFSLVGSGSVSNLGGLVPRSCWHEPSQAAAVCSAGCRMLGHSSAAYEFATKSVASLLQRKPWKSMGDDVAAAAGLVAQQPLMLAGVLPADQAEAVQLVGDIQVTLDRRAAMRWFGQCAGCCCRTCCLSAAPHHREVVQLVGGAWVALDACACSC